jgi:alkane 1-monooxygenase
MQRQTSACAALPFFIAYLVPLATALGLARGGAWAWSTVILVFVITPVLDVLIGVDTHNPHREPEGPPPQRDPLFDLALWVWLPVQVGLVGWGIWTVAHRSLGLLELLGLVLSVGISTGAGAINVAHELMHRRGRFERGLAELLMTSAGYTHFCIEHVRGHHKHVATPTDPASARLGESVFAFLPRTLIGGLVSAWRLEGRRVASAGRGRLGLGDRRLRYPLVLAAVVVATGLVGGVRGVAFFAAQAAVAVILLEIINYVEHYGLERRLLTTGRFERVSSQHSWNAAHRLTNWYLFNLQRHADHHNAASRPYWLLRHIPDSPQLPAGYASMCLLALLPPLWRRVMDPRVVRQRPAEDAAGQ